MRNNRTILLALLIPLLLDLLVLFTSAPTRTRSESTCFRRLGVEVVDASREIEEELEEEEEVEFLDFALPPPERHDFLANDFITRGYIAPSGRPVSRPFGWFMPLLI